MFKYTPCPDVLRKYDNIQRNSTYPGDDHFHLAVSICGSDRSYFECGDFWKHYKNVAFFSPASRVTVPVNGVQINSMFFTETAALVQDKKTGLTYNPDQKFEELKAQQWFIDQLKRMKDK